MGRLIKYFLIAIVLYLGMRTSIALFFYDQLPIAFIASEFTQDQMDEYRARVLIPGFFLTLIYLFLDIFQVKILLRLSGQYMFQALLCLLLISLDS